MRHDLVVPVLALLASACHSVASALFAFENTLTWVESAAYNLLFGLLLRAIAAYLLRSGPGRRPECR